jgi:hypothetical protein
VVGPDEIPSGDGPVVLLGLLGAPGFRVEGLEFESLKNVQR